MNHVAFQLKNMSALCQQIFMKQKIHTKKQTKKRGELKNKQASAS